MMRVSDSFGPYVSLRTAEIENLALPSWEKWSG